MTDATDLTAADWAAMRGRCEAATVGPWGFDGKNGGTRAIRSPGYHGALMCDETYYPWCPDEDADWEFIAHARTDLPLALDALARQHEAIARLTEQNDALQEAAGESCHVCEYEWDNEWATVSTDRARSVVCAKCWDGSTALARALTAEATLADRDATIARLREFLTGEQARYQAVIDAETVPVTFLHRIRGKRDMCGEALAQLPLTPAKEADRE